MQKQRVLLRAGLATLAAVVALVAWLATRGDDQDNGKGPVQVETTTRLVSPAQLAAAATKLGQAVYWAGPMPTTELELEELAEGGVRVSYPTRGEEEAVKGVGNALAIGSYPLSDPEAALREFAAQPGAIVRHSKQGDEVVSSKERPTSVYFVSADKTVQVEVYDPSPQRAMRLALSGRVRAIGGGDG